MLNFCKSALLRLLVFLVLFSCSKRTELELNKAQTVSSYLSYGAVISSPLNPKKVEQTSIERSKRRKKEAIKKAEKELSVKEFKLLKKRFDEIPDNEYGPQNKKWSSFIGKLTPGSALYYIKKEPDNTGLHKGFGGFASYIIARDDLIIAEYQLWEN